MTIDPKISKKQGLRTVPAPPITLCLLVVVQGIIKAVCNVICSPYNEFIFVLEPQLLMGAAHGPLWD